MADSLFDILKKKDFDEPPEGVAIKKFVYEKYHEDVGVTVRERDIIIQVRSAALASTLRMQLPALKKAADNTPKRLSFRII